MSPAQLQAQIQEALAHHRAGRLAEAARGYERALQAAPRQYDLLHLAGVAAYQQGRLPEAIDRLRRACQLRPAAGSYAMFLGLALLAAGRVREAEPPLRRAVQLEPALVEGWDNLAHCLKLQDRLPEALACHERSVALKPAHAAGWYAYGLTLSLCGRSAEALRCHERALAADPAHARAHFGRAQALQQCSRMREAVAAYDRFLAAEPGHAEAQGNRLFALNYLEDLPRERVFAEHAAYGRRLGGADPAFPHDFTPDRRLRVAVLSPDLRTHSCAYFLEPILRHLDRADCEIVLYHDHFREDETSRRLRAHAAAWRNVVGLDNAALERAVRADRPDVLVDLAGHTGTGARMPLLARRLAPVQVSYLGYPNTTGVPGIGWRLTDAIADPPGDSEALATERLVRFAPCAWAYEPPADAPLPAARPEGPVTFGCFNNPGKISEANLGWWARLLASVPDARLLLKGQGLGDPALREHWHARFLAAGLDVARVELVERTPDKEGHLALYRRVDVALDTFPYHGTTTTCEALWMGVPVVTLRGDRHAARVGASLLAAAHHPEWIAETPDEYGTIAAALAADAPGRARWRTGLRAELARAPLLDHAGQAQRFAAALRACWISACEERTGRLATAG